MGTEAPLSESLQRIPLFAALSPDDLEGVLQVATRVSYEPGSAVVEQGAPGDAMYVVLSGAAEVDVGGRFHRLGPGDFFGEMALVTSRKRMATVKAVEPLEALRVPADDFRAFLLQHPTVALSMMQGIVERLREVEERIDAWMG